MTPEQEALAPPPRKAPSLDVCPQREPGPPGHPCSARSPGLHGAADTGAGEDFPEAAPRPPLLLRGHSRREQRAPQGVLFMRASATKGTPWRYFRPSPPRPWPSGATRHTEKPSLLRKRA